MHVDLVIEEEPQASETDVNTKDDNLVRREAFAVSLRREKRHKQIAQKRRNLMEKLNLSTLYFDTVQDENYAPLQCRQALKMLDDIVRAPNSSTIVRDEFGSLPE